MSLEKSQRGRGRNLPGDDGVSITFVSSGPDVITLNCARLAERAHARTTRTTSPARHLVPGRRRRRGHRSQPVRGRIAVIAVPGPGWRPNAVAQRPGSQERCRPDGLAPGTDPPETETPRPEVIGRSVRRFTPRSVRAPGVRLRPQQRSPARRSSGQCRPPPPCIPRRSAYDQGSQTAQRPESTQAATHRISLRSLRPRAP